MQEKISVLIPAYNAETFLKRCMDSVLQQTYPHLEVVIVNDGSKDGTLSLCRQYAAADPRVRVIDQENRGVAATRNTALEAVSGDYILFVDADDWIERDMIEKMLYAIQKTKDADIAFCKHDFADRVNDVDRSSDTHQREVWDQTQQQLEFMKHSRMTGMLWNKLIRSSLFASVRFDPSVGYGEDAQALWRVLKHSRNMVVLDETLYHHVMEAQSISHQSYSSKKFSSIKMWKEIEQDVLENYPQWKALVQERQVANATYLCFEMRSSHYKNKSEKQAMRRVIQQNLTVLVKSNGLSAKMKLYALAVAAGF